MELALHIPGANLSEIVAQEQHDLLTLPEYLSSPQFFMWFVLLSL